MTCESRSLNILNRSWTLMFFLSTVYPPGTGSPRVHCRQLTPWSTPLLNTGSTSSFARSPFLYILPPLMICHLLPPVKLLHHKDHDFTSTFQCAGKPALGLCWWILHTVASLAMASRTRCIGIHNHNYDRHDDNDIISKWQRCWPLKISRAEQGLELSIMIVMMIYAEFAWRWFCWAAWACWCSWFQFTKTSSPSSLASTSKCSGRYEENIEDN